ncbi:MAG: DUF190 domain-containing protein [Chlamydiae bacterium]|nr:DUF190 domain-containing protein [Chlamydiota bacterium]
MKAVSLRIYTEENQQHQGVLVYEWLLEFAKKNHIKGGSVFRGIAGYGRQGILHEEHFFELGAHLPVEVVFNLAQEEAEGLLALLKKENFSLVYTLAPIELGILGFIKN